MVISSVAQLMINEFKNRYNNITSLAVDAPLTLMGNTALGGGSLVVTALVSIPCYFIAGDNSE